MSIGHLKVTEFRELQPEKADTVFFLKTPKAFEEKKKRKRQQQVSIRKGWEDIVGRK